jgi:alpha-tubulin suppressor-like RCC1 family protein
LLNSGATKCWGISHKTSFDNFTWRDNVGLADECKSFVVNVPAGTVQLADGASVTCALAADGTVRCGNLWLTQKRGDRGDSPSGLNPVRGITNAVQIAMGRGHVCAADAAGTTRCWGLDDVGQLGIGHIYRNYPSGLAEPALVALP